MEQNRELGEEQNQVQNRDLQTTKKEQTRGLSMEQGQEQKELAAELKSLHRNAASYPSRSDMLALLGAFIVASVLSGILSVILGKMGVTHGLSLFICYFIQFGGTITFALMQKRKKAPKGEKLLKFTLKSVDPAITLWGVLMVFAAGVVIEPILALFPTELLDTLNKLMGSGGWVIMTSIILAPILEEILFRGVVQESLTSKFGPVRGIIVAAAIFGIVHIVPQQVVNAFFIGLILGYIYYRTKSLIPVIVIHAINNACAQFMYMVSGGEMLSTRQLIANDSAYNIIYITSCVILIVAIIFGSIAMKRDNLKLKENSLK